MNTSGTTDSWITKSHALIYRVATSIDFRQHVEYLRTQLAYAEDVVSTLRNDPLEFSETVEEEIIVSAYYVHDPRETEKTTQDARATSTEALRKVLVEVYTDTFFLKLLVETADTVVSARAAVGQASSTENSNRLIKSLLRYQHTLKQYCFQLRERFLLKMKACPAYRAYCIRQQLKGDSHTLKIDPEVDNIPVVDLLRELDSEECVRLIGFRDIIDSVERFYRDQPKEYEKIPAAAMRCFSHLGLVSLILKDTTLLEPLSTPIWRVSPKETEAQWTIYSKKLDVLQNSLKYLNIRRHWNLLQEEYDYPDCLADEADVNKKVKAEERLDRDWNDIHKHVRRFYPSQGLPRLEADFENPVMIRRTPEWTSDEPAFQSSIPHVAENLVEYLAAQIRKQHIDEGKCERRGKGRSNPKIAKITQPVASLDAAPHPPTPKVATIYLGNRSLDIMHTRSSYR